MARQGRNDSPVGNSGPLASRTGRILCTLASAGLLAAPLHDERLAALGTACLVPLWLACSRVFFVEAIALGAVTGTLYGLAVSLWIPEALQGLGASSVGSVAGMLVVSLWAGAPVFAAIALAARASARWPLGLAALTFGAAVFVLEWLVSLVWWGVPWGLLGYSQVGVLGVAQLALVGGVPLVSALVAALNVAVARLWLRDPRAPRGLASLAAAWLATAAGGLPLAEAVRPPADSGVEAASLLVVQPDLPRGERWVERLQPVNLHRVRAFANRALSEERAGVDALLLPENLLTAPVDATPELASQLEAWVDEMGVPVLTGLVLAPREPDRALYRSAVVWLVPGQGLTDRTDKQRAIPVLESGRRFPGHGLASALLGEAARSAKVEEAAEAEPLPGPVPLAPALCYEVLFPRVVAARRTADSLALVNLADDSWVTGTAATRHLTRIARFRAIEQRLPLIRVAHGGLSAVVDPFGRLVETLPLDAYASTRVGLVPAAAPSLAERIAILGLPIAASLVVWSVWGCFRAVSRRHRRGGAG